MDKSAVAAVLEEIALLLELKGENAFKSRAYKTAARTLETLPEDLATLVAEDRLKDVPGIGDALRQKITELVETGKLGYYEKLRAEFPATLFDLFDLPGLGPKKIKILYEQLKIADIPALEAACKEGKLEALAGFGAKTEANILLSIEQRRSYQSQHRLGDVLDIAEDLVDTLRTHPDIHRVSVAGSLRRGKEIVKDIDLIASASPEHAKGIMEAFVALPEVTRILGQGETKASVILADGLQCDLRIVPDRDFATALHHFTGSKEHNVALRQRAIAQGKKMSEWGLFRTGPGGEEIEKIPVYSEEQLFHELGLDPIPPELRENLGEIEAAEKGEVPRLLEWTELRGAFHNHTNASDGSNTLEEMAIAASGVGLSYLGFADHSKSSFQANGLDEIRFAAQIEAIEKYNATPDKDHDIHLFSGVECDILKDGKLDFDDAFLSRFDYVVASLHAGFTKDEDEMTRRLTKAMENKHVTILGHATGRLLLKREAYPVNLDKIIDCAAETGTWIELNANPWRLDLDWRWWHKARDKGVKCVINADAHKGSDLAYLKIGVKLARKGWLRKEDVMNTLPLAKIKTALGEKRKR
ncbi:DNA polymerase (family 10) [Verrucomicrobium sp. GAS474]|uniref:DNA polymerase/3'-5' exonuclease PolX n=1 Tax=Verrucomicrobium sp. GAS474 TaxID=1882831 RepID=UPI00087CBCD7|nr:DNA polymerase/3'-5' exonuclease PolX [Verrucomicrobium sp. GAS474]SDU08571.1 DNA polymerase (family 10) [Verrucomicrobium sp. GAS474]